MSVTVRPVRSRRDRKAFIDFPYALYRDDPYWIAPLRMDVAKLLNPKKNPFFEHGHIEFMLAEDATGKVVGRIAAIENGMHLKKYNDGVGFFGFYEAIDDRDVAAALFDSAGAWLRGRGLSVMRGPTNPSLNETAGLLVDGFKSEPFVLMTHNPPYYAAHLAANGFERAMTMWAYYIHRKYANFDRIDRGLALVKRRYPGLHLREFDMSRYDREVEIVREIYNEAWSDNWGFVPMTQNEFAHLAKDMKQIVDPRLAYMLELDGEAVGFSIAIPNINQALRHVRDGRLLPTGLVQLLARMHFGGVNEVRLPLMGIRKAYHGRGFDAVLVHRTVDYVPQCGYPACEMSWVLENNHALINALDSLGGVKHKEYAMFEAPIA